MGVESDQGVSESADTNLVLVTGDKEETSKVQMKRNRRGKIFKKRGRNGMMKTMVES